MKPTILTLAIAVSLLAGVSKSSAAAVHGKDAVTILSQTGPINKIEVHGNVELYLSYGAADQVTVYNNYYSESAMVQGQDGVLRITSHKDQKLVVWVSAVNLQTLSAYDNAEVKSFGTLSAIELDVNLFNNASAQLDVDANSVNLKLSDRAKADISGTSSTANLISEYSATLNYTMLYSENLVRKTTPDFANNSNNLVAIP